MESRSVPAIRGWRWILEGSRLFAAEPRGWFAIVATLFVAFKLSTLIPFIGPLLALVFFLLLPLFIAGLMQACRGMEHGQPLRVTYLLSGFQRNAGALITLGGVSLVGNLLTIVIINKLGGEAMLTIAKLAPQAATDKTVVDSLRQAVLAATRATLTGLAISLPLTMALWFSPMLVYFRGMRAPAALVASLVACWRNMLPMFVYGLAIFAALIVVTPLALATRVLDLGLWLLAPILAPSLYRSYLDIFPPGPEPEPETPVATAPDGTVR